MTQLRGFLFVLIIVACPSGTLCAADASCYRDGRHGKGELKHINGLPVLILEGTPQEMGQQAGVLVGRPLRELIGFPRDLLRRLHLEATWPILLGLAKSLEPQIPPDHLDEMDTLVKTAGIDRDLLLLGNTFADISKAAGCSSLIVGSQRSAVSGPLLGRNFDYMTLGVLDRYSLVTVRRSPGKKAFATIGFPGLVGCLSGINEAGLCLAVHEVHSTRDGSLRLDVKGIPYTLAFRRLLEECSTVKEAENLLRSLKRTTMLNLVICDPNDGAVFEITSKNLVVRRMENGICACTNHFCSKELGTKTKCKRLPILEECRRGEDKLNLADVARKLNAVNQGRATMQTMIFEPRNLILHLAIDGCPSSARPLKDLPLEPLFLKNPKSEIRNPKSTDG